ncbi:MAG: flagellar basal body protein FliL [Cereibacter sphaeroides]|uniref:Flagellar protein FliL n=1 Tax=Cereibacter sphaeroides TaxID=1063 RepID=A0A2W5TFS4_CERSP|nr:MAG: flagellar basal body protein FliL [Cereibacter sphaeroides]
MSATKEKKDGPEEAAAAKPARFGKKQKIIIGAVAAVLLAGGAGAFALAGGKSAEGGHAVEEEAPAAPAAEGGETADPAATLVDVPAMVLNMRTATGEPRYLKLHFMLVAKDAASVEKLKSRLPAIIDAYQPFLRELRPEDLAGAAAVFRIKEELLLRAADEAGKDAVADVLIQDLVQQ